MASCRVNSSVIVAAGAVVNSVGSVFDPLSALPWDSDRLGLKRPTASERTALRLLCQPAESTAPPLNTTIGVVATNATLTKAECQKMAAVAHDGLARAIRPAHTLFDGDTIFALSTCDEVLAGASIAGLHQPSSRAALLSTIAEAGALCFARACTVAVAFARGVGGPPSYRDICPSAFPSGFATK